jgi:hydroxyacylglutathione hydrolase
VDMLGRSCNPCLPLDTYNLDTEQARESLLKLAALEPAAAWSGHGQAVTGNVRVQLERAAGS